MLKKLGRKSPSSKKPKAEVRRLSADSASSGGAVVPFSPTNPKGKDVTALLGATSDKNSNLTEATNGHAAPEPPLANAGGTPEEGRLLGEAAGKNDLDTVRQMLKRNVPVNTLDEVSDDS